MSLIARPASSCLSRPVSQTFAHALSATGARRSLSYDFDTIQNLRIGKDTRVIYQGFTGKAVSLTLSRHVKFSVDGNKGNQQREGFY